MRARRAIPALVILGCCLASSPPATAQLGKMWSYDDLLKKADVVVIGGWRSTEDTGHSVQRPEVTVGYPAVEMHTTFAVEAVLKDSGQRLAVGGLLRLKHFRRDLDRMRGGKPPDTPVGLVNAGNVLELEKTGHYLLFLTSGSDDLNEPLSGHVFPSDSVFRLDHLPQCE